MDSDWSPTSSESYEEHDQEDLFSIDWFSEDELAYELIQAGDDLKYLASSRDTKGALPSWLEPQLAFMQCRSKMAQAEEAKAEEPLVKSNTQAHSDVGSFIDPDSHSLDDLVDRLVHPDCDSHEMNNLGTAIVMHADLMTKTSKLKVYSKLNGGMKRDSPGTTQAWLYTPKKRNSSKTVKVSNTADSTSVFVVAYPDKAGPSDGRGGSKDIFHFGGRAHTFHSGRDFDVLIQHGSNKALGYANIERYQNWYRFFYHLFVCCRT